MTRRLIATAILTPCLIVNGTLAVVVLGAMWLAEGVHELLDWALEVER